MYRRKKKKNTNLRSRLEDYYVLRKKARWTGTEGGDLLQGRSFWGYFPFLALKDMHSMFLFKVTLSLLCVLVILFCSLVRLPFSDTVLERVHFLTTWDMDFVAMGRQAAPAIKKMWEGNLEADLVTAPGSSISHEGDIPADSGLIAPLKGELKKTFGALFNPALQRVEMSYGLVFDTSRGVPVRAAAGGRVREVGESTSLGLYVLVEHREGLETLYGYLEETLVEDGDHVEQGQEIARAGPVPGSGQGSLYFEVREWGRPVDPLPLLVGM